MRKLVTWLCIAGMGLGLVHCTEPPPIPPKDKTAPKDQKTPGDNNKTKLPAASLTVPNPTTSELKLKRTVHIGLPREISALYVWNDVGLACTYEGTLYNSLSNRKGTYRLTAFNLDTGKIRWVRSNTLCHTQSVGSSLFGVQSNPEEKQLELVQLDVQTGKTVKSFPLAKETCAQSFMQGPGERMFSKQTSNNSSCFSLETQGRYLVFKNDLSAKIIEPQTGKIIWSRTQKDAVGRIPAVYIHNDIVYTVHGSSKLPEDARPSGNDQTHMGPWFYILRAEQLKTRKVLWNVGPLNGSILKAKITVQNQHVYVQTLASELQENNTLQGTLQSYTRSAWTGQITTYGFSAQTGSSVWKTLYHSQFPKKNNQPIPELSPIKTWADQTYFLHGDYLKVVDAKGESKWKVYVTQKLTSNTGRRKEVLAQTQTIQFYKLNDETIYIRGNMGVVTLLFQKGERRTYTRGRIMYGADVGISKLASGEPTKKRPTQVVQGSGVCHRMDGSIVAMNDMTVEGRFFLPPGREYYGDNQFFRRFCSKYKLSLQAKSMDNMARRLWSTEVSVPEAPIFSFIRGERLYVVSDNGDLYGFIIK